MNISLQVILTSAAVATLISGLFSLLNDWLNYKREIKRDDVNLAIRMIDIKHSQLKTVINEARKDKKSVNIKYMDPALLLSRYITIIKEIRKTGKYAEGENTWQKHTESKKEEPK